MYHGVRTKCCVFIVAEGITFDPKKSQKKTPKWEKTLDIVGEMREIPEMDGVPCYLIFKKF